jgi:hypothetical protein
MLSMTKLLGHEAASNKGYTKAAHRIMASLDWPRQITLDKSWQGCLASKKHCQAL